MTNFSERLMYFIENQLHISVREFEKNEGLIQTHKIGLVNDDYKDIDNYMACGMNEFINKPVNIK